MKIGEKLWAIVDQNDEVCGDGECSCLYPYEPEESEVQHIKDYYAGHSPDSKLTVKRVALVESD